METYKQAKRKIRSKWNMRNLERAKGARIIGSRAAGRLSMAQSQVNRELELWKSKNGKGEIK